MVRYAVVDTETTGLNPIVNELTAIGVAWDGKEYDVLQRFDNTEESEKKMLKTFWEELDRHDSSKLVGFNLDFDWTFLKLRSLKHNIPIKYFRKYEGRIDIRQVLDSTGRYRKGTALKDYAEFFGLDDKDGDSSAMPEMFERGEYEQIRAHVQRDVEITSQILERLILCNVLDLDK